MPTLVPGLQCIAGALAFILSLNAGAAAQDRPDSALSELQSQAGTAANAISWAMAGSEPLRLSKPQDRAVLHSACYTGLASRTTALVVNDLGVLAQWLPIPTRMADLYLRASGPEGLEAPGLSPFAAEAGLCMDSVVSLQAAAARLIPLVFSERPEWREDAVRLEGLAMLASGAHQTFLGLMEAAASPGTPADWRSARLNAVKIAAPDLPLLLSNEQCLSLQTYAQSRSVDAANAGQTGEWQDVAAAFGCADQPATAIGIQ